MKFRALHIAAILACISGCNMDDPYNVVPCPPSDAAENSLLAYVETDAGICRRENCANEKGCCLDLNLPDGERERIAFEFEHSVCHQDSAYGSCMNSSESNYYCGSKLILRECAENADCAKKPGFKVGMCLEGFCYAQICQDSYHIKDTGCTPDTNAACGYEEATCKPGENCLDGLCQLTCRENSFACQGTCLDFDGLNIANCDNDTIQCKPGFDNCDGSIVNGCEANINDSGNHCGSCSNKCDSNWVCADGECSLVCNAGTAACKNQCLNFELMHIDSCEENNLVCTSGFDDCDKNLDNGCEAALDTNTNCGACGNPCTNGKSCIDGTCVRECGQDTTLCKDACLSLSSVNIISCTDDTIVCAPGFMDCDGNPANGCETNTSSDLTHCGSCERKCSGVEFCVDGSCSTECPGTTKFCGDVCIDFDATQIKSCDDGVITCKPGYENCDGLNTNGCEVNTKNDLNNCGSCKTVCDQGQICNNSHCELSCPSGQKNCLGMCIDMNATHVSSCDADSQTITCTEGYGNCDKLIPNGCEINTNTDNNNCGACGEICNVGTVCSAQLCGTQCAEGLALCSNQCLPLESLNAVACESNVLKCKSGFADCDGEVSNGCEVNLKLLNMESCKDNKAVCLAGYSDCDKKLDNGCEINTRNDNTSCGACGTTCEAGTICIDGTCQLTCTANLTNCANTCIDMAANHLASCSATRYECLGGYADCDKNVANGCEIAALIDSNNCGGCNIHCPSGQICANGTCATSCQPGTTLCGNMCLSLSSVNIEACSGSNITCAASFRNCDGNIANGCEINIKNDDKNCGGCGIKCSESQYCQNGVCAESGICGTGKFCNGECIDTETNNSNCGGCGFSCGTNQTCYNGTCMNKCTYNSNCRSNQICHNSVCLDCSGDINNPTGEQTGFCYGNVNLSGSTSPVTFPNAIYISSITVKDNSKLLLFLRFPKLEKTNDITIKNTVLSNIDMPRLNSVHTINITDNKHLLKVALPSLLSLPAISSSISNNGKLGSIILDSLTSVKAFYINNNPSLKSLSFPSLASVYNTLQIISNTALTKIDFPSLVSFFSIKLYGNTALTNASVCVPKSFSGYGSGLTYSNNGQMTSTYICQE